jgi:hypothetical protein
MRQTAVDAAITEGATNVGARNFGRDEIDPSVATS